MVPRIQPAIQTSNPIPNTTSLVVAVLVAVLVAAGEPPPPAPVGFNTAIMHVLYPFAIVVTMLYEPAGDLGPFESNKPQESERIEPRSVDPVEAARGPPWSANTY